jgi:hypothetical protein
MERINHVVILGKLPHKVQTRWKRRSKTMKVILVQLHAAESVFVGHCQGFQRIGAGDVRCY